MGEKKRRIASSVCRLCGARGPLQNSHIVSRAAYRRAMQGPEGEVREPNLIQIGRDGIPRRTTKQMKEVLLCRTCEERFAAWERYAFPVLSQPDKSFPWLAASRVVEGPTRAVEGPVADASSMDVDSLSRFLLSIVWRLGVYSGAKTRQQDAHELATRRFLLGETGFPEQAVLVTMLLDPSQAKLPRVDRLFTSLWPGGGEGYALYEVVILGADARLFMGPRIPERFRGFCFARTKQVIVRDADSFAREHAAFIIGRAGSPV